MNRVLALVLLTPSMTLFLGCPDSVSDMDKDGFTTEEGDCNDEDASIYPQAPDFCDGLDNNCDGSVDPLMDRDGDGSFRFHGVLCTSGADCDDMDPDRYPGAPEVCDDVDHNCDGEDFDGFVVHRFWTDADQDGHPVDSAAEITSCELMRAPEGFASALSSLDCDDSDAEVHPSADEQCDDVDHDCDGNPTPGDQEYGYWVDSDGDGFGSGDVQTTCDSEPPVGSVSSDGPEDCDDTDADVSPDASEACNGVDDDCDGELGTDEADVDGDGSWACLDCDDGDFRRTPGAVELCDGLDNDCDGVSEIDGDGDGFLICPDFTDSDAGMLGGGDCDDTAIGVFPGATEVCDALDQDCDTDVDEGLDGDGDGITSCGADGLTGTADDDCDDAAASTFPGASEACNGVDDDCDGSLAADEVDVDGDGVRLCLDCDDDDITTHPSASELCDGVDNDCSGSVPADEIDSDSDGFVSCLSFVDAGVGLLGGADCDGDDATAYPGAPESCDGIDNDCDGSLSASEADDDNDGARACDDCDDGDGAVYPGAPEYCDGRLNDCDETLRVEEADVDADGFLACLGFIDLGLGLLGGGDCDDAVATTYPGATEACNGIDDDCNGAPAQNEADSDGDGFRACVDCDDLRAEVYDGAPELCDSLDNDCDGELRADEVDWDLDGYLPCVDFSDPGIPSVYGGNDCNGFNQNIHPDQPDSCDGIDTDCDGSADEIDSDGDGYIACTGYTDEGENLAGGNDCAEGDFTTFPGAPEVCDEVDNNCDGSLPASELDGDGDSFVACADCDDSAAATFPGGTEVCDAEDNNCDGDADEDFDSDADGFTSCGADGVPGNLDDDCSDADASVHPDAVEICNNIDDNCDTELDALDDDYAGDDFDEDGDIGVFCGGTDCDDNDPAVQGLDADSDDESICDGDCNDLDPYVRLTATETCDGVDTDCDGLVDTDDTSFSADADSDGQTTSGCSIGGQDCDDRDPHVFAEELYTSGVLPDCAPVVSPGFSHEWHHARISLPSYFFDTTTGMHYVYFRAHHDQPSQVVGVAASADGVTWDAPVGPILAAASGEWDHRNMSNPSVVRVEGAARPYVMLYHARASSGGLRQIGLASATDPLGPFERIDPTDGVTAITAPVLAPSLNPSYLDSGRTLHPSARYDAPSSTLHVWYNGRTDANNTLRIFHATSTDAGLTWTRTDDDVNPGPDPVFEPSVGWEGSSVSQVTWLLDPENPDEYEYWYTGGGNGIGKATGDETSWSPNAPSPILEASAECARMDGKGVSARGVRHNGATDTYHWYYGAASDIGGVDCLGNEDAIFENGGDTVSYVASASNPAPDVSGFVSGPTESDLLLVGDITDSAPDTVVITVESDVDGFLGTATITPADPLDMGVQTTDWSLSVTGLSSGAHDLFVDAVDEADTARTFTLSIVVP